MAGYMASDLYLELYDGTAIGYAEVGDPDGPPVIHLHGNPGSRLEVGLPSLRRAAEDLGIRLLAPDRPGIGLSSFQIFTIREYPQLVQRFADALGLDRFSVTAVSGGGKYACACAWYLPDRVSRVALVSSTCSRDLPGARATPNKEDRLLYPLADRAPWLVRVLFAKLSRDAKRDPNSLLSMLDKLGPADRVMLGKEEVRQALGRSLAEAFRQGGRGVAHDYALEARPWNVPLDQIEVPVQIWHGEDDRLVSPQASRILASAISCATTYLLPEAGHHMFASHANDILRSTL
jgi:pimeloyl-ACP methyl ester carboxylesterase